MSPRSVCSGVAGDGSAAPFRDHRRPEVGRDLRPRLVTGAARRLHACRLKYAFSTIRKTAKYAIFYHLDDCELMSIEIGLRKFRTQLRYEIRTVAADYTFPYLAIASRFGAGKRGCLRVSREANLVIEAYPRSANTYAYHAFMLANEELKVAHHLHAPAQVIAGIRLGIPTLVTIRRAEDAVSSFVLRHPVVGVKQALRSWLRFHRRIEPVCESIVIATFDQVVSNLGDVTRKINEKFNTQFCHYEKTAANDAEVARRIIASEPILDDMGRPSAMAIALPHDARAPEKTQILAAIRGETRLLMQCDQMYDRLLVKAGCPASGQPGKKYTGPKKDDTA